MQAGATTWNSTECPAAPWYARLMPCLTDIAFLLPAGILFSKLSGTKTLFADGDTGWHIRTGEWILKHHTIPTHDIFSFTKAGQPWFAWEWGWDILFALIHKFGGLAGVGFVSVLLLGVISVLLYKLVANACGNYVLAFFVTAFGLCAATIHWLARPHLFTWLFLLCFLHLLGDFEQRASWRPMVLLPSIMLLWVNIHGAFFVGIALVVATGVGKCLELAVVKGQVWRVVWLECKPFLVCATLCFAATFVNPYTWHLHKHIMEYLGDAKLLDNIQEYQSISFHCGPAIFFEVILLVGATAAFWRLHNGKITPALLFLLWAHLALLSARNIPLFVMVVAPTVAAFLQNALKRLSSLHLVGEVISTISEICEEIKPMERLPRVHVLSGAAVFLLALCFASRVKGFEPQFNVETFPAQIIDLVGNSRAKRIFTYDQWGDYLIYRLYPSKPVFMDGRSDFYGDEFVTATQHILGAQYDWKKQLQHFGIDMVLVRPDAPLATVLKTSPGWITLFDDGKVLAFETAESRGSKTNQDLKCRGVQQNGEIRN